MSIASIAEILYTSTNVRIEQENHPVIFDLACGYSPRAYKMIPKGYSYIGGDLSNVVEDIQEQLSKQEGYEELLKKYCCVDVTDQNAMVQATKGKQGEMTIVTQGLLTYLNAEQKHLLCQSVHALLKERGGCWLIPDASSDCMLKNTFKAIMGNSILVEQIYGVLDKMIHRNRDQINWKSTEEMVNGLIEEGFVVEVLPLWNENLEMKCLTKLKEEQAQSLIEAWKQMHSLKVTVK